MSMEVKLVSQPEFSLKLALSSKISLDKSTPKRNEEYGLIGSKTPVTVRLSESSAIRVCPTGFSLPKIFWLTLSVKMMEYFFSRAVFESPYFRGRENTSKNSGSA